MSIVMNSLFGGAIDPNKRKGAVIEFLTPFISESIGTERAFDVTVRGGKTSEGKQIYFPQDDPSVIIANSLKHIFGGLTPGAVTSFARIWDGATGRFTDYGTQRDGLDEVVALMSGVRVEDAKPLSSMPFILTSFNGDKKNMRSKFARTAYSARSGAEQKLGAYVQYTLESFDSQNKLYITLKNAETLGVSKSKLKKILEERLTKTESKLLLKGIFKAPSYSENAFKSIEKRLKKEDVFEGIRIGNENDTVMEIYDDLKKDLKKYKLGGSTDLLNDAIDSLLSPGVEEVRDLRSDLAPPTGTLIAETKAVLPVDVNKDVPVNANLFANNINAGTQFNLNNMNSAQKIDALFNNRGIV
jgi:hypothetical protein